jgi:hypothetical protein
VCYAVRPTIGISVLKRRFSKQYGVKTQHLHGINYYESPRGNEVNGKMGADSPQGGWCSINSI